MRDEIYQTLYGRERGFAEQYMPNDSEYSNPTEMDIGKYGWMTTYISSTFLNGWINYVKPIKAFTISRYRSSSELATEVARFHDVNDYHTHISRFDDDVLILCKEDHMVSDRHHSYGYDMDSEEIPGDAQGYWFFWFDCDVSDCSIGRFATNDTDSVVMKRFEDYVRGVGKRFAQEGCEGGDGTTFELDTSKFRGWMSF